MALDRKGHVWTWGNLSHPLVASATPSQPVAVARLCGPFTNPYGLSEAPDGTPRMIDGLPTIVAIASYHAFDLALDQKGHVWGWGDNQCGQLGGDASAAMHIRGYQALPALITGMPPIKAMAAGRRHAIFLARDGSVWATGDNEFAQLGKLGGLPSNTYACSSSAGRGASDAYSELPQRVQGFGPAKAVAADAGRSAVIDADGHVWIWGRYP